MPPTTIKGIRSLLGHGRFYRIFIKDFSKISRPLCRLHEKEENFEFDGKCKCGFEEINAVLIRAPTWQHQTGARILESCVMLEIMQWEQSLGKEHRKSSEQYNMPTKLSMKHKRTTQLQERRCWQWFLLLKILGRIYWDPTSSYTLVMQQ